MPIEDFLNATPPAPVEGVDLGLPEAPQAPTMPQAPQGGGIGAILRTVLPGILGGAMGPGAGTGLLQGTVVGTQRREAQEQQAHQDALQRYDQQAAVHRQEQGQYDQARRSREQILQQTLTSLRTQAKDLPDKAAYDAYVEAYAHGLQSMGYRLDANYLRKSVPFVAPKADQAAWDVLQKWQTLPNNKELLEKHPEQAANAMIPFDRDGDGTPELVRLQDLSVLAGAPLAMTAEGKVFGNPGTSLDVTANADGILRALIAKAKAEGKQVTPDLLVRLQQQAIRMAADARPSDTSSEPLVAVIGPDGQPVLVPRGQAVGKRPASTREQGRPVTSSDANRLAELDTSLDDVAVLESEIATVKGVTGYKAQAGAMLPNVVTELTGWGQTAKEKQAVIDRVKQVIGKALEGGVLRKEDEYKYVKILPTIGDTFETVKVKIAGLKQAIQLRRQRTVEALADAGFDTAKFDEKTSPGQAGEEAWERGPDGKLRRGAPSAAPR